MSDDNKLFAGSITSLNSEVTSFSDTFIITTSSKLEDNPKKLSFDAVILNLAATTVAEAIGKFTVRNIFLRGCISFGVFYVSSKRKTIIGPAIDEAAEYHMKSQWIGASATRSAHHFLTEMEKNNESFEGVWKKEDIILDDGMEKEGWVVGPGC